MTSVLIAYDGSPSARRALERAVALAHAGDRVDVVGVGPVDQGDVGARRCREALEEARSRLARRGLESTAVTAVGNPGAAICRVASEGYDVVVVGSRNLPGVEHLLLGSVADWVAQHAPVDVLIAR